MKKIIGTILTVITVSILLSGCSKAKYPIIHFTQKEFVADGNGVVEIKGQFLNSEPGTLEANINRKAGKVKVDKDQNFHIRYQMDSIKDTDFYLGIKDEKNRIAVGTTKIDSSEVEAVRDDFEVIRTSDIISYFNKYDIKFLDYNENNVAELSGLTSSVVFNVGTRMDGTSIKEGVYLFEDPESWNKANLSILDWWNKKVSNSLNKNYNDLDKDSSVNFLYGPNFIDSAEEKMIKQIDFFDNNRFLWTYRDKEKFLILVSDPELTSIERGKSMLAIQSLLIDKTFSLDKDEEDSERG